MRIWAFFCIAQVLGWAWWTNFPLWTSAVTAKLMRLWIKFVKLILYIVFCFTFWNWYYEFSFSFAIGIVLTHRPLVRQFRHAALVIVQVVVAIRALLSIYNFNRNDIIPSLSKKLYNCTVNVRGRSNLHQSCPKRRTSALLIKKFSIKNK